MPRNRDHTGLVQTPPSMAWLIRRKATLRVQLGRVDRQLTEELPRKRLELAQALAALTW